MRVGRGCLGNLIIWARAVRPKTAKPPKKLSVMDRRTNQPTKWVVELRSTRLKIIMAVKNLAWLRQRAYEANT